MMASRWAKKDGRVGVKYKENGKMKYSPSFGRGTEAEQAVRDKLFELNSLAPTKQAKAKQAKAKPTKKPTTKKKSPAKKAILPAKIHHTGKHHKTKSDTTAGQVESMMMATASVLMPPPHISISPEEWPFWESIMRARARNTWTEADLEQAAILARAKYDVERLSEELRREGDIMQDSLGKTFPNPKHRLIVDLTSRVVTLSRAIQVDATSTQGRGRDTGEKTKKERDMRAMLPSDEDDLLATPVLQ